MRSTSTSSSPAATGLFRLLVGAGLVRLAWREFWKWALPKKSGPASVGDFMKVMKSYYLEPMKEQLMGSANVVIQPGTVVPFDVKPEEPWCSAFATAMATETRSAEEAFKVDLHRQVYQPPPPRKLTRRRKLYNKLKWKLRGYKPIIMTQRTKEELEYYD